MHVPSPTMQCTCMSSGIQVIVSHVTHASTHRGDTRYTPFFSAFSLVDGRPSLNTFVCVCVCVYVYVRVCVHVCGQVCTYMYMTAV